MVTNTTYAERIERARAAQLYEPLRPRLQQLLDEGYTRWEITSMMFIGMTSLETAIAALGLQVGQGRRERNIACDERYATTIEIAHAEARDADLVLVRCVRETYGPIGRGFSTA